MMVGIESESKFQILRNKGALEFALPETIDQSGIECGSPRTKYHVDVYVDHDLAIYHAGYCLRYRFDGGSLKNITLKTIVALDHEGLLRIEEKGRTFLELAKKVKFKLGSLFQDPGDEKMICMLEQPELLRPVVALTKSRSSYPLKLRKAKGRLCIDAYTYILPKVSKVFAELEIEGGSIFDPLRAAIKERYAKGRWPKLGPAPQSKFTFGLTLGGII